MKSPKHYFYETSEECPAPRSKPLRVCYGAGRRQSNVLLAYLSCWKQGFPAGSGSAGRKASNMVYNNTIFDEKFNGKNSTGWRFLFASERVERTGFFCSFPSERREQSPNSF